MTTNGPWCQRWSEGQSRWRHEHEYFDPKEFRVEPIAERDAKAFVLAHHYSGSYPASKLRYGLLSGDELMGVAVLSVPMQAKVLTSVFPDLDPMVESLEVGRFVLLDAPAFGSETWFLARIREQAAATGIRGLVSFSDPVPRTVDGRIVFPGHAGTIYRASSATYLGRSTPRTLCLLPDGTVLSNRAMQKVRGQERGHDYVERKLMALGARPLRAGTPARQWLADAVLAAGAQRLRHDGNHRYAFRLGMTARARQRVYIKEAA